MKYITYYEESTEITNQKYMEFINRRYNGDGKIEGQGVRNDFKVRRMRFFNPAESILFQESKQPKYSMTVRNTNDKCVYLEKKTVQNELIYKASTKITREQCNQIIGNDIAWMENHKDEVVKDFYRQLRFNGMKPGYVTEYVREVFGLNKKDYVIFDKKIAKAAGNCKDFFAEDMIMIQCLGTGKIKCTSHHAAKMPEVTQKFIEQQECNASAMLAIL
jgi:hypothetical protein